MITFDTGLVVVFLTTGSVGWGADWCFEEKGPQMFRMTAATATTEPPSIPLATILYPVFTVCPRFPADDKVDLGFLIIQQE